MAQVHEKRIIHLDIKPDNFLLAQGVLKIIDLGLAKLLPPGKNYIGINIMIFFLQNIDKEYTQCMGVVYDHRFCVFSI